MPSGVASTYQAPRALADLPHPWRGPVRLGRRRAPDDRLPQRLRLDGRRACPSGDRPSRLRARPSRLALLRPDRGRDLRRRGSRRALRAPEVALHELGHRGDDGRDPHRPRCHRPRHDRQDPRLVPRPPRRRHGRGGVRPGVGRGPGHDPVESLRRGASAGGRGPDGRGAVQRCGGALTPARPARGGRAAARLHDHGGGDDEPRGRAPRARLSRGRPRGDDAGGGSS